MPQLKNVRRERFCQNYISGKAQGLSNGRIYLLSGYLAKTVESADSAACRLLQQPDISARIVELAAPNVQKIELDTSHFIGKFEQVFNGSIKAEQYGHANRSAELQARISGVLTDKLEVSVAFEGARNVEDVLDDMVSDWGGGDLDKALAFLDDIKAQLIERAASRAKPVADTALTQPANGAQAIEIIDRPHD